LAQSNDLWMRDDAPPQESYLDTLARYYGAGVHIADFGKKPEEARVAINTKVADDTHQLIRNLIPENAIDAATVAVLTNALYFKAPWQSELADPVAGDFHQLDGSIKSAQMLKTQQRTTYYAGDGFVATSLPYYGGDVEMALIVPDAGSYDAVRASLTGQLLAKIVSERGSELVQLTLPKFKLDSSLAAAKVLQAMGMKTPFSRDKAEFPKLVSPMFEQVYISDVLHQATVAIDEKGTEAAAATAILLAGTSSANPEPPQPKIVTIDRPFLFVIRDNPTGAVLFVGQVVSP
jgi:serpin B